MCASPYLNRYYGMQYSFGANVREGKVTPSLSGVLVTMDPVAWHDQVSKKARPLTPQSHAVGAR